MSSISWGRQADPGRCIARSLVARGVLCGLLLSMLGFVEANLCAQEIKIKLVDGRNGQSLGNTCVNVWVGADRKEATAIPTDNNGTATLRLTTQSSEVDTSHQWGGCVLFGAIDPVLGYHDDIRINVGYVLCQANAGKSSWLKTNSYTTKDLVQSGIVSPNTCGTATAERKPGELIIFVRPLSWWEKWKQ